MISSSVSDVLRTLPECHGDRPILVYGPTASGKSALALDLAARFGGVIVNADAIQVFDNWQLLSARPDAGDLAKAPHALYGHLPFDAPYSAGHWLREVADLLQGKQRLIITGGTGLYFKALTEGLAEIPATPPEIRDAGNALRAEQGLDAMIDKLDPETRARLDLANPMRVQRAWEVQRATGRGLAAWQDDTPPPLVPLDGCTAVHVAPDKEWLNARIETRFHQMVSGGVLDEVRANLDRWDPTLLSMKAIGAPELIAHLSGQCDLDTAIGRAIIATQQFAKRQRTWGRSRMGAWHRYCPSAAT